MTDDRAPEAKPSDAGDESLLALVDRLAILLDRSDLTELEVEAGGTGLLLRKPGAMAPQVASGGTAGVPSPVVEVPTASVADMSQPVPGSAPRDGSASAGSRPAVRAPLTGIYWGAPSPGSAPYVQVGGEVAAGQIVGLIEAMKLFNEIKSDLAGRVVRIVAENGQLVKAKQPLIEVEPL